MNEINSFRDILKDKVKGINDVEKLRNLERDVIKDYFRPISQSVERGTVGTVKEKIKSLNTTLNNLSGGKKKKRKKNTRKKRKMEKLRKKANKKIKRKKTRKKNKY